MTSLSRSRRCSPPAASPTSTPGLMLWTVITFLVLLVVLRKFAWGPIVKMLDERERTIRDAIEQAKKERAEAERLLAEQKTALAAGAARGRRAREAQPAGDGGAPRGADGPSRKEADELIAKARRQI